MRRNLKFHFIAIAAICAIVTVLYLVIGPAPQPSGPADAVTGDRYIQIYSATWGRDCNPYIRKAQTEQATLPRDKNKPPVQLKPVTTDNVLPVVSDRCNGRLTCNLPVQSGELGVDPLNSCFKSLEVSYRCFTYDRLWSQKIAQGQTLRIDCNEGAAPPVNAQ